MKILLTTLAALILLTGCEEVTTVVEVPVTEKRFNGIDADTINIVTDSETGCKYIYVVDGAGNYRNTALSPLYKKSGVMDCD